MNFLYQLALKASLLGSYEYSSTQIELPDWLANEILAWGKSYLRQDWLTEEGLESNPHVTVKYGLLTRDPQEVLKVVGDFGPVEVILGNTFKFEQPEYDVLCIEVVGGDSLLRLNELVAKSLRSLANADTYPRYIPHVTIAYCQKGMLPPELLGDTTFAGEQFVVDRLTFSRAETGEISELSLAAVRALRTVAVTYDSVTQMKPAQINRLLKQLKQESSQITDEFIAAGRGNERPSEYQHKMDPLSQRAVENMRQLAILRYEIEKRAGPDARYWSELPSRFGPVDISRFKTGDVNRLARQMSLDFGNLILVLCNQATGRCTIAKEASARKYPGYEVTALWLRGQSVTSQGDYRVGEPVKAIDLSQYKTGDEQWQAVARELSNNDLAPHHVTKWDRKKRTFSRTLAYESMPAAERARTFLAGLGLAPGQVIKAGDGKTWFYTLQVSTDNYQPRGANASNEVSRLYGKALYDPLPVEVENYASRYVSPRSTGAILTVREHPILAELIPFVDYEGQRFTAVRKRVDQLDQVTFSLKKEYWRKAHTMEHETTKVVAARKKKASQLRAGDTIRYWMSPSDRGKGQVGFVISVREKGPVSREVTFSNGDTIYLSDSQLVELVQEKSAALRGLADKRLVSDLRVGDRFKYQLQPGDSFKTGTVYEIRKYGQSSYEIILREGDTLYLPKNHMVELVYGKSLKGGYERYPVSRVYQQYTQHGRPLENLEIEWHGQAVDEIVPRMGGLLYRVHLRSLRQWEEFKDSELLDVIASA